MASNPNTVLSTPATAYWQKLVAVHVSVLYTLYYTVNAQRITRALQLRDQIRFRT